MSRTRKYAVYRLGVNADDQKGPKAYVAIVKAATPEEAIKRAVGVVVFRNERLGACPYSRLSREDKIAASLAEYARQRWLEIIRVLQERFPNDNAEWVPCLVLQPGQRPATSVGGL